jgi:hypothetical protein
VISNAFLAVLNGDTRESSAARRGDGDGSSTDITVRVVFNAVSERIADSCTSFMAFRSSASACDDAQNTSHGNIGSINSTPSSKNQPVGEEDTCWGLGSACFGEIDSDIGGNLDDKMCFRNRSTLVSVSYDRNKRTSTCRRKRLAP